MSEEIKETKNECFCQNKDFRNFLATTAGVFVGGFLALSLHSAINKPPVPIFPAHPAPFYHTMPAPIMKPFHDCPCHRKARFMHEFKKGEFKKPTFEIQKKFEKQKDND